ncbi:hypothetical protein T08_2995 [Trichinella sp. T8]|nr:hypothetical protein T08_2995 [Trichinella sp. T8]
MNRVLYVVTVYCFTWWTCGHAAQASAASMIKFQKMKWCKRCKDLPHKLL